MVKDEKKKEKEAEVPAQGYMQKTKKSLNQNLIFR
jgi:hypothetical protein